MYFHNGSHLDKSATYDWFAWYLIVVTVARRWKHPQAPLCPFTPATYDDVTDSYIPPTRLQCSNPRARARYFDPSYEDCQPFCAPAAYLNYACPALHIPAACAGNAVPSCT
jgi:hypothetical protein